MRSFLDLTAKNTEITVLFMQSNISSLFLISNFFRSNALPTIHKQVQLIRSFCVGKEGNMFFFRFQIGMIPTNFRCQSRKWSSFFLPEPTKFLENSNFSTRKTLNFRKLDFPKVLDITEVKFGFSGKNWVRTSQFGTSERQFPPLFPTRKNRISLTWWCFAKQGHSTGGGTKGIRGWK